MRKQVKVIITKPWILHMHVLKCTMFYCKWQKLFLKWIGANHRTHFESNTIIHPRSTFPAHCNFFCGYVYPLISHLKPLRAGKSFALNHLEMSDLNILSQTFRHISTLLIPVCPVLFIVLNYCQNGCIGIWLYYYILNTFSED